MKRSSGKKALLAIAGTFSLIILAAWILWTQGVPQRWWENHLKVRLIRATLSRIEPLLPFKIESIEVDSDWASLREGRIQRLTLVIRRDRWRARLVGPLELGEGRKPELLALNFNPDVEASDTTQGVTQEMQLALWIEVPRSLTSLSSINAVGAQATIKELTWVPGLVSKNLLIEGLWEAGALTLELTAPESTWTRAEDQIIRLERLKLQASSPPPQPATAPRSLKALFSAKSLEALWNEMYFNPNLEKTPISIEGDQDFLTSLGEKGLGARVKVGRELELKLARDFVDFKLSPTPLPPLLALARGVPAIRDTLPGLDLKTGFIKAQGVVRGRSEPVIQKGTRLEVSDVSLEWPLRSLAVKGLKLSVESQAARAREAAQELKGTISVERLAWKKFKARVASTEWTIGKQGAIATPGGLGLQVDGLDLKIGSIIGHLPGSEGHSEDDPPAIGTSLHLPYTPASKIAQALCMGGTEKPPIPPMEIRLDMPRVWWGGDWVEITGAVTGKLFGGDIRLDELAFYDLKSPVPETNFNLGWERISLKQLGEWVGFGEMDGKLKGFIQDAVMQDLLPTRFFLRTEVEPDTHGDVVFSPEAMKNFVRLFAGNDLSMLPGIANWLAFGWPSRLFGGYDVLYAGISVLSSDGSILVETLDPPRIVEKERRHFILYGPRFKMPLQSTRYPLVLDAASMGNFVNRMFKQLESISKDSKDPQKKEGNANEGIDQPNPEPAQTTACRYSLQEL